MAGDAIAVQRERPSRQGMVAAHHADVVAVIQPLVRKRHRLADLRAGRQVGQDGGKVANGEIGRAFFQQTARVACGQRHHAHRDPGRVTVHHRYQGWHEFGCGGVCHRQNKRGVGLRSGEIARCQRLLQCAQRIPHGGPDVQCVRRGLQPLAMALEQVVAQRLPQAAHGIAHGRLRQ